MRLRNFVIVGALALVAAAGGLAFARHHGHRGAGFFKARVSAHIDDALDIANASAQQKTQIYAVRDRTFEALEKTHQNRKAEIDRLLTILEGDTLDSGALAALRKEHEAAAAQAADAITKALVDAHAVLNAEQRNKIADWAKRHVDAQQGGHWGGEWMRNRMLSHVDDMLDKVKATAAQKTAVRAAIEHVMDTVKDSKSDHSAHVQKAIALFRANKLDPAQVSALRVEGEQQHKKIADAVEQAIHDTHGALTPQQRKALIAEIRSQHGKWHHQGG